MTVSDLKRLTAKIKQAANGCWEWTAYCDDNGYGQFKFKGRTLWAHRFAYAAFVRSIPDDREIDHDCENSRCVNPKHLICKSALANATLGGHASRKNAVAAEQEEPPF